MGSTEEQLQGRICNSDHIC